MSDNVDIIISKSGTAESTGVEVGIVAPSLAVQKVSPLPAWWPLSWTLVVYYRRPTPINVGRCPRCQDQDRHGPNVWDSLWNCAALCYCLKCISSSGLVTAILNPSSATSGDIEIVILKLAVVEKVGVANKMLSVCRWELKLFRPAENIHFFHGWCPWFFRPLKVSERATFTRRTTLHMSLKNSCASGCRPFLEKSSVPKNFIDSIN